MSQRWVVAAGLLAGVACSSDDGGAGNVQSYARQVGELTCERTAKCCAEAGHPIDEAQCRQFLDYAAQEAQAKVESGDYVYDEAAADECLSAARAVADDCSAPEPPACDRVIQGTKGEGEACEDDDECEKPAGGDAECDFETNKCVQEARGKAGDGCRRTCNVTGSFEECHGFGMEGGNASCYRNDGLYCSSETNKCETLGAAGAACSNTEDCEDGLFCGGDFGARTCAATLAIGADCSENDACGEGYCAEGKCAAAKAAGEACDKDSFSGECGPQGHCSDDGKCEAQGSGLEALACGILGGGG